MKLLDLVTGTKGVVFLTAAAILLFSNLNAQQQPAPQQPQQEINEDYTQEELRQFVDANKVVAEVQMSNEEKMMEAIEEEGLDVNKFNQILTARQDPNTQLDASEEELQKFDQAAQKVMEIQQQMQGEVRDAIEQTGMSIEKYDEILFAYQNSPKVQQDVNQLLQAETGEEQNE